MIVKKYTFSNSAIGLVIWVLQKW